MRKKRVQSKTTRQTTELVFQQRQLHVEDIEFVKALGRIDGTNLVIERSTKQYRLKQPITVPLDQVLALGHKGLVRYILEGLTSSRPSLIPLIVQNKSLIELARHFLRRYSGSIMSLYAYTNTVAAYAKSWDATPDQLITDARKNKKRISHHEKAIEEYIAQLQDAGRTPGRIHGVAKQLRTWYRCNGVELKLSTVPRPKVTYKDRSPTQQELALLLDAADLRGKCVVSLPALGGFRETTLSLLKYRHVREDLEKGLDTIHVHVERDIVKGEYDSYDTFIRGEAIQYLKQYLDARRTGRLDPRIKPETITDNSPLIRDALWDKTRGSDQPKPVGPKAIYKLVHELFVKTGLVKPGDKHYTLRFHTFRKFFKTNLVAAGVPESHADYFLGHVSDTYNQVRDLGVDKLRASYSKGQLGIRPQSQQNLTKTLISLIQAAGKDPSQYLNNKALSEPNRVASENPDQRDARILLSELTDYLMQRVQQQRQPVST
ncbi:MAG TPA: hypothetical protein VFE98_08705 [Candidatus Bathyarchaeia archaeon]|nr:hypothetical protein [Candidatus Bathyarchaeia archaeon]